MTQINYNFNASALGVGGYFVRNGKKVLVPSLASVALAPDGGEGWASVTNYDENGISFTRAESRVSGYETSENFFTTQSDVKISNLSVFGKVNIGQLQATVLSTRNLTDPNVDEATFELSASFHGIFVAGVGIVPKVDVTVLQATHKKLLEEAVAELEAGPVDDAVLRQIAGLRGGDPIRSTMVESMEHGTLPAVVKKEEKHVLRVPGFAKIHFGELLVKRGRRRLNLLRFDFDSTIGDGEDSTFVTGQPESGFLTVASGDGNGEPVWPRG